jgi:hypothetical protein
LRLGQHGIGQRESGSNGTLAQQVLTRRHSSDI